MKSRRERWFSFFEECILLYLMRSEPTARPNVLFLGGRVVQLA